VYWKTRRPPRIATRETDFFRTPATIPREAEFARLASILIRSSAGTALENREQKPENAASAWAKSLPSAEKRTKNFDKSIEKMFMIHVKKPCCKPRPVGFVFFHCKPLLQPAAIASTAAIDGHQPRKPKRVIFLCMSWRSAQWDTFELQNRNRKEEASRIGFRFNNMVKVDCGLRSYAETAKHADGLLCVNAM